MTREFFDSPQLRDALMSHGLYQTIDGEYIAASIIARIIPNRKTGTAICKDRHGNRLAVLHWPQVVGDGHG
jgi:hypothetical protein